MRYVFVEARPKGRKDGEPITAYVVETDADHALYVAKAQAEAIGYAKKREHTPHVARCVTSTTKKKPGYWGPV